MSEHTTYTPDAQLRELLTALVEGNLTDDQQQQLEQRVATDEGARAFYVDVMSLHAMLTAKSEPAFTVGVDHAPRDTHTENNHPLPPGEGRGEGFDEATSPTPRSKSWLDRASRHPKVPAIAIAATVLIAALVVMGLVPMKQWMAGDPKPAPEEQDSKSDPKFVARLTNWHEDVWADDTRPPLDDPRLNVGRRLKIESGFIEVTYLTGARVVIEGPAEFYVGRQKAEGAEAEREQDNRGADPSRGRKPVDAANAGFLRRGKLVARIEDERAKGFFVDTPYARVEDLGTEFGVIVDERGGTTTHVYEGLVVVAPLVDATWKSRTLAAKESVQVDRSTIKTPEARDAVLASLKKPRHWLTDPTQFARTRPLHVNFDVAETPLTGRLPLGYRRYMGEGSTIRFASAFAASGNVAVSVRSPYFRNTNKQHYGDVTALTPSGDPQVGYNAVVNSGALVNEKEQGPIVVRLSGLSADNYTIKFFMHNTYAKPNVGINPGSWNISGTATAENVRASYGFNDPLDGKEATPPTDLSSIGQVELRFTIAKDGDVAQFIFTPKQFAANWQLWVNGFELSADDLSPELEEDQSTSTQHQVQGVTP